MQNMMLHGLSNETAAPQLCLGCPIKDVPRINAEPTQNNYEANFEDLHLQLNHIYLWCREYAVLFVPNHIYLATIYVWFCTKTYLWSKGYAIFYPISWC